MVRGGHLARTMRWTRFTTTGMFGLLRRCDAGRSARGGGVTPAGAGGRGARSGRWRFLTPYALVRGPLRIARRRAPVQVADGAVRLLTVHGARTGGAGRRMLDLQPNERPAESMASPVQWPGRPPGPSERFTFRLTSGGHRCTARRCRQNNRPGSGRKSMPCMSP